MKEEDEQKLNFWKHVSKSIESFNHEVFINNNKESSIAEKSVSNSSYFSKPKRKAASKVSPKPTPFKYKTIQNHAYYKDQSLKTHPVCNKLLNDLKLRTLSVDLSCSHCNFECNGKNSFKATPSVYKNGKCDKTVFYRKNSSKHVHPIQIKSEFNKKALEKHKLYPGFKPSDEFFVMKEGLFSSNEQKLYLPELKLFANKTPVEEVTIQLHRIDETIAFCRNLNLQPVWKNCELYKSPVKLKKISKLRCQKS